MDAHIIARAIQCGLGGITCIRFINSSTDRVRAVLEALEQTHARLQKMQLVRTSGKAWWSDEVLADIEESEAVLIVEIV
jgi:hypothetical protein